MTTQPRSRRHYTQAIVSVHTVFVSGQLPDPPTDYHSTTMASTNRPGWQSAT